MDKKFLIDYLNTDSPSCYEIEAQKLWVSKMTPLSDEIETDNYGNAYALLKSPKMYDKIKVVLDAHCDEIGWVISRITEKGFIYVKRNGGTDNEITATTPVKILTKNGKVKGFFGSVAIHLKDKENPVKPSENNIFIDVGATSDKEVKKLGIEVGNYVVADRNAEFYGDKCVVGKSIDDKIGGFIISEVFKRLKQEDIALPFDLYAVNSVQEEVGLRGAKMITETIKPNIAICFDVGFDTNTPMVDKEKWGDFKMGGGLIFRQGYDVHPNLLNLMKKTADNEKIPYTLSVGGAGGTNTTSYNLSNGGVVTSILSIPLRYMHTPMRWLVQTI